MQRSLQRAIRPLRFHQTQSWFPLGKPAPCCILRSYSFAIDIEINMNRYCVLLFVFFVLLMPGEASIKRYCRQKTKVSWDSLKRLKAGDYTRLDLKTKCYLRCFMEKIGVINNESELEIEKVLRHFPHDTQGRMRTLLQQCKYKLLPSDHLCEKAYKIAKCIIKAYPEIFKKLSFV